jgi:MFS family permease
MDRLGRRITCQLSCLPLVVAWILVWMAQSVGVLYVGRLLAGVGGGKCQSDLEEIQSNVLIKCTHLLVKIKLLLRNILCYALNP